MRLLVEAGGVSLWQPWTDAYLRWRLVWSVAQAGATSVAALALGLPVAWVLARFDFSGRVWVLRTLMLAIAVGATAAGAPAWALVWHEDTLQALWNTARFSTLAVALATVLGVAHAVADHPDLRTPGPPRGRQPRGRFGAGVPADGVGDAGFCTH